MIFMGLKLTIIQAFVSDSVGSMHAVLWNDATFYDVGDIEFAKTKPVVSKVKLDHMELVMEREYASDSLVYVHGLYFEEA
ncbi:hypothetical protein BJV82DRAFT_668090 [Fennellomyces sp. T-0311]|nr:hypothetical protein BJV82DRAFT_668090 [Fennellomyces sp. T-0311]